MMYICDTKALKKKPIQIYIGPMQDNVLEVLSKKKGISKAASIYPSLLKTQRSLITSNLVDAEGILIKYADHDFSYTDAVSFAIMKRQKTGKAFCFDKYFLTAGFENIP